MWVKKNLTKVRLMTQHLRYQLRVEPQGPLAGEAVFGKQLWIGHWGRTQGLTSKEMTSMVVCWFHPPERRVMEVMGIGNFWRSVNS